MRRLTGLETEYAIRYTPEGPHRASNARVCNAVMRAVARRVRTVGDIGEGAFADTDPIFVANGGAFNLEPSGGSGHAALLEGATPECVTATQLLTYQRAQEALLVDALHEAPNRLSDEGYPGSVSLLKNCRDVDGHLYGAQENYTVEVASGWRLVALRTGLVLTLPAPILIVITFWLLNLVALLIAAVLGLVVVLPLFILSRWVPAIDRIFEWFDRPRHDRGKVRPRWVAALNVLDVATSVVGFTPWAVVARVFALHPIRRQLAGYVASRPIVTGAGTLDGDRFRLSEKAAGTHRVMRTWMVAGARAVFDLPGILKGPGRLLTLQPRALARAFDRHQRLQVALSDANMTQSAEFLKVGTMLLLLEMVEAGALTDAPRPKRPIAALQAIDADPELHVEVELADGTRATALQLQRWYLRRAQQYAADAEVTSIDRGKVLQLWQDVLDRLEHDRHALVGTLDWVTKAYLLEQSADLSAAARKKIDLKYHDLVDGYFRELEATGLTPSIVEPEQVERARTEPPPGSPAVERARYLARFVNEEMTGKIGWDYVRIGGALRGRLIRLGTSS